MEEGGGVPTITRPRLTYCVTHMFSYQCWIWLFFFVSYVIYCWVVFVLLSSSFCRVLVLVARVLGWLLVFVIACFLFFFIWSFRLFGSWLGPLRLRYVVLSDWLGLFLPTLVCCQPTVVFFFFFLKFPLFYPPPPDPPGEPLSSDSLAYAERRELHSLLCLRRLWLHHWRPWLLRSQ